MLVYTEERKRWVEYHIPVEQSLQDIFGSDGFPVEEIRGIRETFGTHGHRMGALQTRLTFHDLNDVLVARCLHLHWNTTATVEFGGLYLVNYARYGEIVNYKSVEHKIWSILLVENFFDFDSSSCCKVTGVKRL